ncbi:hypothetical protein F2Q70_00043231 [Brassica cretica]|nr:hypothetical protein F2Q70_00043231 [Brassica cretica]
MKFYWEEKNQYGVYRDEQRYARDLDGNTIRLHNMDIRRTKVVPEIYTKDEINEMFYGVCGEQEKNKEAFQMKLDGVYYPLNDSTCMEEMKQDIARIQHATDVARSSLIDRDQQTSIDVRQRTSIDNQMPPSVDNPPRPHTMNKFFTKDFSKERSEEYKYLWTKVSGKIGTKRDRSRPENLTVLTCPPRPWARTTITKVTSPMCEDDQHHGHLAHGRGRPAPWSPRPWARTTSTAVTSPMVEDDQHCGHLAHGQGRSAPGSPYPRAKTIQSRSVRLVSILVSSV